MEEIIRDIPGSLNRLVKSRFRSGFKLDDEDISYIYKTGFEKIRAHAKDFIMDRLAPENPKNDGKQTPYKGHPVFKAQHATAACCRKCLRKWHQIPEGRCLSSGEVDFVLNLILEWIRSQDRCGIGNGKMKELE